MAKTISTVLNLSDKFSDKLNKAGENVLIFKIKLQSCGEIAKGTDKALEKMGKNAADGKIDEARKKVKTFEEKLKNCEKAAKSADKILGTMAKTAIAAGTAAVTGLAAIATSSVNTYKDFQQSMANTGAIAGVEKTSEEFKALEQAAREAGRTTSKTAKEAADALGYMKLAGWETTDSINALMPVLRLSEATGADLATTFDLVTDSMSAMGIATSDLSEYLDIAANANNRTNQTATQMLETFIGAGGMFKELGTSMEEAAALSGVLANRGIKGSEGATSLNSILINLMGNSKSSAEALERLGVSAYDSNGKFLGVTQTLKAISAAMKTATDEDRGWFLSKLGGKTQIDTLNALLSGVETLDEKGRNELERLTAEFEKSEGALEKMADAMRNTLSGSMAIAGSAMDDFKITIGEKLEPYISRFLNWFAEKLPKAAEKVSAWLDRNLPKAINFCKAAFEKIKPVIKFVIDHFSQIIPVAAGVVAGLKAFSIITKVVSLYKKLQTAGSALKAVQLALNTSMLACPLTWIAGVLGVAAGAFLLYKNAAEEAKSVDLEEHFESMTLSMEEMDRVAKQIVNGKNFEKLVEQVEKFSALEPLSEKIKEDLKIVEKTDWKLSVGLKLSIDEQNEYKETVNAYVEDIRKYFEGAFQADWNLFDGNTEVQEAVKRFYSSQSDELNRLGNKLKNALEKGFADNVLKLDEEREILNIMNQMQKIKEGLAQSEYETTMISLQLEAKEKAELNGGQLTAETYNQIKEKAIEAGENYKAAARTSRAAGEHALKNAYKESSPEYKKQLTNIDAEYLAKLAQISAGLEAFTLNTVDTTYGEDLRDAQEQRIEAIEQGAKGFDNYSYSAIKGSEHRPDFSKINDAMNSNYGINKSSLENMRDIRKADDENIEQMKAYYHWIVETIDKYNAKGEKIPQSLLSARENIKNTLGKIKELDSLISEDINKKDIFTEIGKLIPESKINDSLVEKYSEQMRLYGQDSMYVRYGYESGKIKQDKNEKANKFFASVSNDLSEKQKSFVGPMDYKTVTDIFSKSLSFLSDTQTTVRLSEASSAIPVDLSKYNEKVRKKNKSMEVITKVNTKVKPENIDIFDFSEKLHNTINRPVTADIKADANVKAGNVNTSDFLNTLYGTMNSLFTGFGINLKIGAGGIINKSSGPEKGNATGTPYFGGGLTQINENGGEIINLPTGAQIIPSDKSAQMIRENARNKIPNISMINMSPVSFEYTPYFGRGTEMQGRDVYFDNFLNSTDSKQETKKFGDININVNIDGNIIGPDNFADEVGGKICGQVADLLNSM